jgi:N-acetylneuraminate synthase/N,N'-diacetyllegionaminate synthase
MKPVEVATYRLGPHEPVFVIAEAGVNHNGDLGLARQLISAARQAGADAVKFQTWRTDELVALGAPLAEYQRQNAQQVQSQYELLKALELTPDEFRDLKTYAQQEGILFLSTPDEEASADFLAELGVPAFKIGSGEVTNPAFLAHVARKGRPVLLSTGMSTLAEVEAAVRSVEGAGNTQLVLLHCVSSYPADIADCNLSAMETLRRAFGCPVGFSDHTLVQVAALAAVALGAVVIEKHLTLDKRLPGPDHSASLDPTEFACLVDGIRQVEKALGDGQKRPTSAELETKKVVQKSLVTARPLRQGERLEATDIVLRRATGGLQPGELPWVVGRRAGRDIPAGTPLQLDMLA